MGWLGRKPAACLFLEFLSLLWGTCALVSLLKTDLSQCSGSSCGRAQGSSFFPCLLFSPSVPPQLETTAMASTNCVVFSWHHQGRVECLFLELSPSHNIHFLRVTRGGRIAWGSVGTWHAFSMPNGPHLCLRSFSCCLGARLRDLTLTTLVGWLMAQVASCTTKAT